MQVTEPHNAAQPLEQVINSVRAAAEDWHLAPDDLIFLNGSRVEGFENQYSDVDIWLVSKSDPQSITSIPVFCWADGLHLNSSAYAESQMLALTKLVNDIPIDDHTQVRELPLNTLVLGGDRGLYGRLTGYENLRYFGALNYMNPKEGKRRFIEMLKLVGLEDRGDQLVKQYSRGMKQRLHLARGLLTNPDVIFMDEPTIGIDPVGAQELRELVPKLVAQGVTVLLTTHYMFEADQLCDTIAIINHGSLVALGTPREIKQGFSKVNVAEVVIKAPRKGLVEELGDLDGVQRTTTTSDGPFRRVTLYTEVGVNLNGRVQDLVGQDNLEQFVDREPTLEEAYISILK